MSAGQHASAVARPPQNLLWRKSSASLDGNCVEVAATATGYAVRDSKRREGAVLTFTGAEWTAFLAGVANGEFAPEALRGPQPES